MEWLSEGKTAASFCRQDGMPSVSTLARWTGKDKSFAERVARARDVGFGVIAEDCLRIADDGSGDVIVDDKGNERVNSEFVARSKLRIETRLKLLACWDPRRYGAKVEHSLSETPDAIAAKIREAQRQAADLDTAEGDCP